MEFRRFQSAAELGTLSAGWLQQREAMNNVFFGVFDDADRYLGDNFWGAVTDRGDVVGVAFRTPPWPVAVANGTSAQALVLLLDELWEAYDDEFEMLLTPEMAQVVSRHAAIAGRPPLAKRVGQAVYQTQAVRYHGRAPGKLRAATLRDIDVVAAWMVAFHEEALSVADEASRARARRDAQQMVAAGELFIWEHDDQPVSMAAARGTTPNGIRISYVFTPERLRNNGYATSCVAALSQGELDAGRSLCFLFADRANPTSNRIYQRIGFELVGEVNVYAPAGQT